MKNAPRDSKLLQQIEDLKNKVTALEAELKISSEAALQGERREQRLFESSPIALWEEDWSELKLMVDRLREQGVTDFVEHFATNEDDMETLRRSTVVTNMNQSTVEQEEFETKQEVYDFLDSLPADPSHEEYPKVINGFISGKRIVTTEIDDKTLAGKDLRVVENVLVLLEPKLEGSPVELTYESDSGGIEYGMLDGLRLRQILINLLNNAIKFTRQGKIVITQFSKIIENEDDKTVHELSFCVEDSGIGIPEEKMETLFESFSQVDVSTTREYGGTGLGLAITKSLVELMGGKIWAESVVGSGTRFYFILPVFQLSGEEEKRLVALEHEETDRPIELNIEIAENYPLRILLFDDSGTNQKLAIIVPRKMGYDPVTVNNDAEAIEKAKTDIFDLILMDIEIPGVDGIQATREIRQLDNPGNCPYIVAMTANAMAGDRELYIAAGMNGYIDKPFKLSDLLKQIQKAAVIEETGLTCIDGEIRGDGIE